MTSDPHSPPSVTPTDVDAAVDRLDGRAVRTPLVISEPLSERTGSTVAIKAEHRQRTGSFKLRGALNTVFALDDDEAGAGVVTASSGNHGIGTATAARARGVPCTVYLPRDASPAKVAAIGRLEAEIVIVDDPDTAAAERAAREAASGSGRTYVSPYNDPRIVAGQGTIGREIVEQWAADHPDRPPVDAVVVAVGGGGLISGIGTALADRWPDVAVVGASPANDPAMAESVARGHIVEVDAEPTFSDGTAGGLEPGSVTFDLCRHLVGRWVRVPEWAIAAGVRTMIDDHHELVEGAAGLAVAAGVHLAAERPGSTIVVVSCGANVSSTALARMLDAAGDRALAQEAGSGVDW